MNSYVQNILTSATPQQLMQLYSARTDEELNKLFFQIASQPTPSSSKLMDELKCELNTQFHCEFNKISGNILVHFHRKSRVTTISIMNTRYGGYELALLDGNSLRYVHSIGYSDVRMFDTDVEVIEEIKRIYSDLCQMQQVYNNKRRERRKKRNHTK
jgi:hypothetical protein